MATKDWITIEDKKYYKQATYTNKYGATVDAKRRRKRGQKVRILKRENKYMLYIRN